MISKAGQRLNADFWTLTSGCRLPECFNLMLTLVQGTSGGIYQHQVQDRKPLMSDRSTPCTCWTVQLCPMVLCRDNVYRKQKRDLGSPPPPYAHRGFSNSALATHEFVSPRSALKLLWSLCTSRPSGLCHPPDSVPRAPQPTALTKAFPPDLYRVMPGCDGFTFPVTRFKETYK